MKFLRKSIKNWAIMVGTLLERCSCSWGLTVRIVFDPIGTVRTEVAKLSAKFDKIDEIDKKMIDVNKLIDQVNVNTSKIFVIESQVLDLRNNKVDVKKPGIK